MTSSMGTTRTGDSSEGEQDVVVIHDHHRRQQQHPSSSMTRSYPHPPPSPSSSSATASLSLLIQQPPPPPRRRQSPPSLTVQDIVHWTPHESPVETILFQHLQEQQQQQDPGRVASPSHHSRTNSSTTTSKPNDGLFHCIPDESLRYYIGSSRHPPTRPAANTMLPTPTPHSSGLSDETTGHYDHHRSTMRRRPPQKPNPIERRVRSDQIHHRHQHHDPSATPLRCNRTTAVRQGVPTHGPRPNGHRRSSSTTTTATLATMAQQLDDFQNGNPDDDDDNAPPIMVSSSSLPSPPGRIRYPTTGRPPKIPKFRPPSPLVRPVRNRHDESLDDDDDPDSAWLLRKNSPRWDRHDTSSSSTLLNDTAVSDWVQQRPVSNITVTNTTVEDDEMTTSHEHSKNDGRCKLDPWSRDQDENDDDSDVEWGHRETVPLSPNSSSLSSSSSSSSLVVPPIRHTTTSAASASGRGGTSLPTTTTSLRHTIASFLRKVDCGGGCSSGWSPHSMLQQWWPPHSPSLPSSLYDLWYDFEIFVRQRQKIFLLYLRYFLLIVVPAIMVAFILFYMAGNPPTGKVDWALSGNGSMVRENGDIIPPNHASASWWLLFMFVRQALTFSLAQIVQVVIVDFWCLNTHFFVNAFGRLLSLFLTSWKGWPFIAFLWGIFDFILLYGESKFASHWLYWQRIFYILTDINPSGDITQSLWYTRILSVAVSVGLTVGLKRLWLGFYLGRKTYANHYEDLFRVYKKILTLCAVGELSRQSLTSSRRALLTASYSPNGINKNDLNDILQRDDITENISLPESSTHNKQNPKSKKEKEESKVLELFDTWEVPSVEDTINDDETVDNASVRNVLEFRNALAKLDKPYMLGIAWGDVSTRQKMVMNSQSVFWNLKRSPGDSNDGLRFDIIAELCEQPDGTLHPDELKSLIRLLRPDRDGFLSLAEFVKSVDSVYKEAKLIHASVKNSEKIDREFEKALNIPFYTIVLCIILSQIGLNPLALFISLSPLILGFSWMIGSASSKMFEGWLFILIRRPYNIGDRIHIGNIDSETNWDGSASWIVQDVTLFHTVAVFGMTGERASMSNGSLASSRVLNMARSPNAIVYVNVKFSTVVPFQTIQMFERILRDFVQARPREWASFAGFRATRVVADLGFIEYVVHLIHRESWQSALSIYESKAEVTSFCLELSKKLEMRYETPSIRVDLTTSESHHHGPPAGLATSTGNATNKNDTTNCTNYGDESDDSKVDDDNANNDRRPNADQTSVATSDAPSVDHPDDNPDNLESHLYHELMVMYHKKGGAVSNANHPTTVGGDHSRGGTGVV